VLVVSGLSIAVRLVGVFVCVVSIIWGYSEYKAGTIPYGPLVGIGTGAIAIFAPSTPSFNATETRLQNLLAREDERSATDKYNRETMLKSVRHSWVEGILKSSLHKVPRIELVLVEKRDAVTGHPFDTTLLTQDREDWTLPPGTKISDFFERSLLILGEPGSGKSIKLLELAEEMIDRAEKDPHEKIPVVFNLSSWTDPTQSIAGWLIEELRAKYIIPKKIAASWVENNALLLLLDGLDEVTPERREACVEAINCYIDEHLVPVAVCCRKEEYDALSTKLELQNAVLLQPLTPEMINDYLKRLGPDLDSLREVLRGDQELQEFAKTPLILSIMTLAYRGISDEELQSLHSTKDRTKHLFKTYVDRMFERTGRSNSKLYPKEDTIQCLSWLARKMWEHGQTVFLIERMQPSWLETKAQLRLYPILYRLVTGLMFGLVAGLVVGLVDGLMAGLIFGLGVGMVVLLSFGGGAVIQHYTLRFILNRENHLPRDLVSFLDYATERVFLRKVGGGYIFIHRMVMDYFASLELEHNKV